MASGTRRYQGTFHGTGAPIDIRHLGWRPREIELVNVDGGTSAKWFDSMPNAAMTKTVAGVQSYVVANGITPLADGFRLGADADLNVDNELVHFNVHE